MSAQGRSVNSRLLNGLLKPDRSEASDLWIGARDLSEIESIWMGLAGTNPGTSFPAAAPLGGCQETLAVSGQSSASQG